MADPTQPYTGYRAFLTEGARCGILTCLRCGAALLLDPTEKADVCALHDAWHAAVGVSPQETNGAGS